VTGRAVALLNPWFWPEVRRGSERIVHDLAQDLLARGDRPRIVTSHPGRPTRTVEEGVPIVRNWRPPEALLRKRNFQEALTQTPFTLRELLRGDDEVAHAFFATDAAAALRWKARTGRPVVFSYMGVPQRNVVSNKRRRLPILEQVTTQSDAVVTLSKAAQEGMWRWLGVESHVVYPGVDLERFAPGGERAPVPTIACAGDPADGRKRAGLLVEAFALVRREHPEARLRLMQPRDPAVAERLAAPGVEFFPSDPASVPDVFRDAWISGLASYNEAFGLVLVESLACGTPVFGMRDGGVPEIIDRPEVGRLFDDDRADGVARAMLDTLELAADPASAAACRERAEVFSTRSGAEAYAALYEDLLSAT
jgi:phosphatidylinositol alpha-mannosyltransferase